MRKSKRTAIKLERRVQALAHLKVAGTPDERSAARRKLANGLSGRYQHGERVDRSLVQTVAMLKHIGVAFV